MSSMTNSLERLRKEKEEVKRQRREFKIKFVCLYVSILSHLKANPDNKVTKGSFGDAKKITVANDGFFFDISFKYDYARNKVRIIVSEESLSLKVRLTLRLTASKAKWRIVKISHKKFKYIFRVMKPQLIEELIVFLIRYL
ncbi:hypothetical protein ORL86_26110 [Klebsiella michiganensis]|uniref:hypothetical protein n=1 Tax=Klebsiella michiganensis TaxID=1134687 RepID=UPI002245E3A0|nr:hypothetical protein [Klebsiella michiganensis]MCW9462882.1 hypothetical protein [Klebsiella michiganensis]